MISTQINDYSHLDFLQTKQLPEILQSKIEIYSKKEALYKLAAYPTCLTGVFAQSCLFINPFYSIATVPALILGYSYSVDADEANCFKSNAELLLAKLKDISHFYRAFKEFEISPEDEKVKKLFDQFSKLNADIKWIKFIKQHQLIHPADLILFESTGIVFLMDAISNFLKTKKINSTISKNWEQLLKLPLHEIEKAVEPWKTIDKFNPVFEAYRNFFNNRKNLNSIDFANTIGAIFEDVVLKSINNNLV